jgi:hypothetical protein
MAQTNEVLPDRGSNQRSTTPKVGMLTITPPMQLSYILTFFFHTFFAQKNLLFIVKVLIYFHLS